MITYHLIQVANVKAEEIRTTYPNGAMTKTTNGQLDYIIYDTLDIILFRDGRVRGIITHDQLRFGECI